MGMNVEIQQNPSSKIWNHKEALQDRRTGIKQCLAKGKRGIERARVDPALTLPAAADIQKEMCGLVS